jgi:hypothetical protein
MAIGWLTVLQSVPWSDVISNAPKVAEGAKKLWKTVGRKSVPPEASDVITQPAVLSEAQILAALPARTSALEAAVADLHGQMLVSSELIKALAEQNAQLIQRIEANRVRVRWIGAVVVVLAMAVLLGLLLVFSR